MDLDLPDGHGSSGSTAETDRSTELSVDKRACCSSPKPLTSRSTAMSADLDWNPPKGKGGA